MIIDEITSNLSGEFEKDFKYLMDKSDEYYENDEIVKEIGKLIQMIMDKAKYEDNIEEILLECVSDINSGNSEEALSIIEPLINYIESTNIVSEDDEYYYYNLDDIYEEVLISFYKRLDKEIRVYDIDYKQIYYIYGLILYELNLYEDSIKALNKALKYNPISREVLFELAENYKVLKDYEAFYKITSLAHNYSYTSLELGRVFRNYGYYFNKTDRYEEAVCMLNISLSYDNNDVTTTDLGIIMNEHQIDSFDIDTFRNNYDINLGPNPDVLGIAYNLGKEALTNNSKEGAQYFLGIAYELSGMSEIKELLDQLKD